MARKRQVQKGFRRGERKHYPDRLTRRIEKEFDLHPVTVRKMTDEERERLRNGSGPGTSDRPGA